MRKIGIVEDDEKLSNELALFLNNNGLCAVSLPETAFSAEDILGKQFDMVLLDIGLPNTDGLYLCKELRKRSEIPIIMITSRNTDMAELMSMNCGADDFVSKPFHLQILLARIEAVLKRVYKGGENVSIFSLGSFHFDVAKGIIFTDTESAELSKNELKILHCLAKHKDTIVSREEIIAYLWDSEMFVDDNTLTVNMTRLRGKLDSIGVTGVIETKRGLGYILKCSF
ncbi:response regulator transcription factor [[Clostridium] polysaccharolyticum]|uniref:Stage 0 sporulation protein A homolog n=1 Tax=[Clostridium] polysaccharolyticum TaxID=29364 RepID=A0A1I0BA97_9FIRM|nr:response regulator transcription factor [[Clostridium] polysaccharolyticum]SET03730.1 DNA-binding response regulator, OmpR family, contains REC and winged-helix (wHTH) domain [[Clostridium] polysaccharolyticum]